LACREAIAYALNKTALAATHGGTDVSVVANVMTPTNIAGYDQRFNPYPTGDDSTGDLNKAQEKLVECGYPDGFTIKFAFTQIGTGPQVYSVLQQSLGRIGIVVDALPFDDFATYLTTGIGSPENSELAGIGLVASGWSADYNSPLSFWSPLVDGRKIRIISNQNLPQLENAKINELLDQIELGRSEEYASINMQIEKLVAKTVTYIPVSSDNLILFRPGYLSNVYVQQALGANYDLVNIGVNPKPGE
jgi:peptide/nickel transport system substrate-binding protein